MLLLLLMNLAAIAVFARQFLSFYHSEQIRQLSNIFQPIIGEFEGKSPEEIAVIAQNFYRKNQSFTFVIQGTDGNILFSTPGVTDMDLPKKEPQIVQRVIFRISQGPEKSYTLRGYSSGTAVDYRYFISRSFLALGIMIVLGIFGAILFAKKVTKPLEDELLRERIMEENQRLFFFAASHELKTPIAAASALVEGMIANIGDYKDHPKYLRECLKTFDAQTRLVSEILEIVKLSDDPTELLLLPLNLAEIGNALIAEYQPIAEQRGVKILAELPEVSIWADRRLLHRALSNVISNAVQNTPENETVQIRGERRKNRFLRFCILNRGVQIPNDLLSRLFEPFYRLDPARKQGGPRSGLGLTIVQKSLERMKISFALENVSEGVLFWMDLPMEIDN
jgi:two-component system sensor histidine kinase VanS